MRARLRRPSATACLTIAVKRSGKARDSAFVWENRRMSLPALIASTIAAPMT